MGMMRMSMAAMREKECGGMWGIVGHGGRPVEGHRVLWREVQWVVAGVDGHSEHNSRVTPRLAPASDSGSDSPCLLELLDTLGFIHPRQ